MISKHDLTVEELLVLQSEMRKREKSAAVACLMLLGGHMGLHRFYFKRNVSAAIQLGLLIFSIVLFNVFFILADLHENGYADETATASMEAVLLIFILARAVFLGLLIWLIIDAFRINKWLREWNGEAEQTILQEIFRMRKESGCVHR